MFTNDKGKDVFVLIKKTVGGSFDKHLVTDAIHNLFEYSNTISVFGKNNFWQHLVKSEAWENLFQANVPQQFNVIRYSRVIGTKYLKVLQ